MDQRRYLKTYKHNLGVQKIITGINALRARVKADFFLVCHLVKLFATEKQIHFYLFHYKSNTLEIFAIYFQILI